MVYSIDVHDYIHEYRLGRTGSFGVLWADWTPLNGAKIGSSGLGIPQPNMKP